jgi:hypothetical protein
MGDRANFGVRQRNGQVMYIYGHWAGEHMFQRLAHALRRVYDNAREHDEPYANRIIISDLIGLEYDSDLGWGVAFDYICDNEHSVPIVDLKEGTVTLYEWDWENESLGNPKFTMSTTLFMDKYIKL